MMEFITGATKEIRSYRFSEGGSFDLTVAPDGPVTLHILGIGRDQDNPADEHLADRIDALAGEIGGITRTWGTTWSVAPDAVDAIHLTLGPVAHRSVEVPVLDDSAAAWRVMRASVPGRVYAWWTWHPPAGSPLLQVDARSHGRGREVETHLVDHGPAGPAQLLARDLLDRHGWTFAEEAVPGFVQALAAVPGDYSGFTASGA